MTSSEFKIRYNLLIDISSTGCCTASDQELAHRCSTTTQYVSIVLLTMVQTGEIDMASAEGIRTIVYRKSFKSGTSKRSSTII
jgi:hypothetical protein